MRHFDWLSDCVSDWECKHPTEKLWMNEIVLCSFSQFHSISPGETANGCRAIAVSIRLTAAIKHRRLGRLNNMLPELSWHSVDIRNRRLQTEGEKGNHDIKEPATVTVGSDKASR